MFLSEQMYPHCPPVRRTIVESAEYRQWAGEETAALAQAVLGHGLHYYPASYYQYHEAIDILI